MADRVRKQPKTMEEAVRSFVQFVTECLRAREREQRRQDGEEAG